MMKKFPQLADINQYFPKTAVALGTFDGVHIGHQKIISQAVDLGRESGGSSVVFTFDNHPLSVINPRHCPPQIITPADKATLIANLGADALLSIPFTRDFLNLSPQDFISLLVENLQPEYLVVGPNYHFGYKGAGTPDTLRQAGDKYGFTVIIHPAVYIQKTLVSSTTIRKYIQEGRVDQAAALLGRSPSFRGEVIVGDGRGRKIGFPTANLTVDQNLVIPGNGVYAVLINIDSVVHKGVANIGVNPTFQVNPRRIEVYIFDYSRDLYGQTITIDFLHKLRNERKFTGVEELSRQIRHDIEEARKYY